MFRVKAMLPMTKYVAGSEQHFMLKCKFDNWVSLDRTAWQVHLSASSTHVHDMLSVVLREWSCKPSDKLDCDSCVSYAQPSYLCAVQEVQLLSLLARM